MRYLHEHPQSSYVTALFADSMLSFVLPKGATLEVLAARLALLDKNELLTVSVKLGS